MPTAPHGKGLLGGPTRWALAAAALCLFCHVSCAAAAEGARPVVLQLHWYPQAQFAGCLMAQEKGFFRQAGLDEVSLRWAAAGDNPLESLAAGKVDFCTAWLSDAMVRRARGSPVVHLAQITQKSAMMLVTRRESGIVTPADMTGKRVGLWGGDFDVRPRAFFKKYGVEPIIVPQSNSMLPFLRGAVSVASAMHYNEYHKLFEAGLRADDLRVFLLADYGMDFPEDGLYCSRSTRQDRPEACRAMVRAIGQGWDYALAHEAETLDAVMEHCARANVRTNRNHQRWMLRSMGQLLRPQDRDPPAWGSLAPEVYRQVGRVLVEQGLIDKAPAFEEFHQPPAP